MTERKLAMLHIKKQYERTPLPTQLPRSASPTSPSPWASRTTTSSSGASASRGLRTRRLRADSTRPLCASPSSSPTNRPKWCSRPRCSIPTVTLAPFSLPHRRGLHLDPAPARRGPAEPAGEAIGEVEPDPDDRGGSDERNFDAGRSQFGLSRQRRCRQADEGEQEGVRAQTEVPRPQEHRRRLIQLSIIPSSHPIIHLSHRIAQCSECGASGWCGYN